MGVSDGLSLGQRGPGGCFVRERCGGIGEKRLQFVTTSDGEMTNTRRCDA